MPFARSAVFGFLLASTLGSVAIAQDSTRSIVSFGISAGTSRPVGQITNVLYDSGHQLGALAEARTPFHWLAIRADAGYQGLGGSTFQSIGPDDRPTGDGYVNTRLYSASASFVLRIPNLRSPLQPYVLGGFSSYWLHQHLSFNGPDNPLPNGSYSSTNRMNGTQTGFGLELLMSRVTLFAEERFEHVGPAPLRFTPISAGFRLSR